MPAALRALTTPYGRVPLAGRTIRDYTRGVHAARSRYTHRAGHAKRGPPPPTPGPGPTRKGRRFTPKSRGVPNISMHDELLVRDFQPKASVNERLERPKR